MNNYDYYNSTAGYNGDWAQRDYESELIEEYGEYNPFADPENSIDEILAEYADVREWR